MGLQQSKEELLYQQVNYGNVEGIKALCRDGAGLEWIDKEGKTPLIVACMNPGLYDVAKTLIELGAKVDAYRPSRHGGTPLHHAAKRGLERTVKLLLSYGANALVLNDDCQTPLEVARAKGFTNVVRAIENHICIFSGWLRELYGPGFLELLAPQLLSRKVWVAVLPTGSRNPTKPFKLELAIYPSLLDARPRMVIALWKANLEEPKFQHSDPSVTIVDNSTIPRGRRRRRRCRTQIIRQTRIKLAAANESDKQQLQAFCNACKGIPQVNPAFLHNPQSHAVQATAPTPAEDLELAMAINASIQTAIAETPICDPQPSSGATAASTSWNNSGQGASAAPSPSKASSSQWVMHEARLSGHSSQQTQIQNNNMPATKTMIHSLDTIPSAPPVTDEITEDGPVQYPSIDVGPVDVSSPSIEQLPCSKSKVKGDKDATSSCVICLDAPVEGACVPCGHMAGCMSCLNEVKAKKWGCPVCRANISQVIRLYAV
ncbi:putative E3 ubiquitin-protein ligase XBAT35 [Citrus sinensis]|uniref:putative E3 ubiquitin-protein ligase XBAT35 isoform X1 n=1 Tax=Citrus sinensis TaxID=2711 RepID=UPI00218FB15E|nr:putative E3 ubiquitin-protein ligase XBAT35 isoform X1 [Citrus sinensis]KAH9764354.1 putative E3 ubiquitin-protein ligase XBAT35 [Citrus sinensis]